jgi:signal transduction histidine kinase
MESFLGVPIRRGDTVLGSLYLTNKEGGLPFTAEDETAVLALGSYAAVAIHNLHLLTRQRALVKGLITAQEEERRAVAYDLHDGLTQYVMASHAHLEAFQRSQEAGKTERAANELKQGLALLKEAVLESRRLVNGLRLLALDDLGLAGALEQLFTEEKARAGWRDARFIHNLANQRYSTTLETTVYRVAQEALTNVRKHARADQVSMMLIAETTGDKLEPVLVLDVHDTGVGFVLEEKGGDYSHFGIPGMIERVRLVNGSYSVKSAPGEGTNIHAEFPIVQASGEEQS